MTITRERKGSWWFEPGQELVPGRSALDLLGGGHRYEVYLAWDEHLHTVVAVKMLRPGVDDDARGRTMLAQEGAALRRLQHPVLPRCFETDVEGTRPYLVLEYLDGPRLSSLIRRHGALAVEQALPLGLQLCSALHYLHAEGMVHLDVKPKNVIMGAAPRLVDLSIAMPVDRAARQRAPIGTDAYMAPEQCGVPGRETMGPPADIWGLGVTLYEAMIGRLPFPRGEEDDPSPERRFPQLGMGPAPLPKDFPPALCEPVVSCMEPDPGSRPTASELAGSLERLVDALPQTPRITRRRPRT